MVNIEHFEVKYMMLQYHAISRRSFELFQSAYLSEKWIVLTKHQFLRALIKVRMMVEGYFIGYRITNRAEGVAMTLS